MALALETPGLLPLMLTISIAGIVRGFTGFGTALIFVPVAGLYLPPADIIVLITLTGIGSTAVLLPRAWAQADRRDVGILAGAALLTVPLGVWAMAELPETSVRWSVTLIAVGTLIALMTGWRYRGGIAILGMIAIGFVAGFTGGLTGLTGPVVILFYLAGQKAAQIVRANTILFLAALDVVIAGNLFLGGFARLHLILVAALLAVPYMATTLIGQRLFDPRFETLYRRGAYAVIAVAVLRGLPLFS